MATPEGKVKAAARKILKAYGVYHFMPVTGGFGTSGVFDEVVCVNGYFLGLEYKATSKKKPTPLQHKNARKCREAGKGLTLLIHDENLDVLAETLEYLQSQPAPLASYNIWPSEKVTEIKVERCRE